MTDFKYDNSLRLKDLIPESEIKDIDVWIKKYPGERKRPPIMPTLKIVQEYNGNHLTTEMMQAVAEYLDVPRVAVYEVATFYSMFNLNKMGKYVLSVCTNISCSLRGSDKVVKHLEDRLNIKLGETTEDGLYSIKEVECMAACGGAPMLEVDKVYHENLTPEKIDQILSDIASMDLKDSKKEGVVVVNKVKPKQKAKPKTKKKAETKPEPVLHLNPAKVKETKPAKNIESALDDLEKEIEDDLKKNEKTVKKEVKKPTKTTNTKQKSSSPNEGEMSSLERAMLRSSDDGE